MNIELIREDIPELGEKLFLNSAGASLVPGAVNEAIREYLKKEEQLGGYLLQERMEDELARFYEEAAKMLHCQARNIAFTISATDGYVKALLSIDFKEGDLIVTTDDDYSSNQVQFLSLRKRLGIEIVRIAKLENGDLDMADFQSIIEDRRPKLVAVSHVPTNSGLVQDVRRVGEICRAHDLLFLLDACQSVGQFEVDLTEIHCDFLVAAGRKFLRGPRGTGLLYVSDRLLDEGSIPLLLDNAGAVWTAANEYREEETAKRFETWERSNALLMGLQETIRYANDLGLAAIGQRNEEVIAHLRGSLSSLKGVRLHDRGSRRCSILTFTKEGRTLEQIADGLQEQEVYFSISNKRSGVIDFEEKGIDGAVRLSPHYFNTMEEMDRVAEIIEGI